MAGRIFTKVCGLVLLCGGTGFPLRAAAPPATVPPVVQEARRIEQALSETIQRFTPAFVFIGGGSGILISADGLMLTNHHVAGASKRWRVRVGTKNYLANVVGTDPQGDITLLKLAEAKDLPFVEFADSDKLAVGQQVIAIGNPFMAAELEGDPTVTLGIISALHRFHGNYSDAIQTDAPINPGNSGGPLLTLDGKLAGINGQIATRFGERANTGIGLAISAVQIQRFLPILKAANGEHVYHGFIRGLVSESEESGGLQNGARIKDVRPGTLAEKLGFQKGDRITYVENYKLFNFARFLGVIGTYPAGTALTLRYERGGVSRSLNATLETLRPGDWGFTVLPVGGPDAPLVILKPNAQSPAAKAGLQQGDVIMALNGKPIKSIQDWVAAGGLEVMADETAKLKVRRGKNEKAQELEFEFKLAARF